MSRMAYSFSIDDLLNIGDIAFVILNKSASGCEHTLSIFFRGLQVLQIVMSIFWLLQVLNTFTLSLDLFSISSTFNSRSHLRIGLVWHITSFANTPSFLRLTLTSFQLSKIIHVHIIFFLFKLFLKLIFIFLQVNYAFSI